MDGADLAKAIGLSLSDIVGQQIEAEQRAISLNRRFSKTLTDLARKGLHRNDVVVKLPWTDNVAPTQSEEWKRADVVLCGEPPHVVGHIPFRIWQRIELGRMVVRNIPSDRRRAW